MPTSRSDVHTYLRYIRELGGSVEVDLSRSGVVGLGSTSATAGGPPHWTTWVPEGSSDGEQVFGTPGASGAVSAAMLQIRLTRGSHAVIAVEHPGYPMFQSLADALGLRTVPFSRGGFETTEVELPDLEDVLQSEADLALVCITDPHNPTGVELSKGEVASLAARVRGANAHLLVDRVFADFADAPACYESISFDGYLTRSFSKSLGRGGVRFGWLRSVGAAPAPDEAIDVLFGQPMSPTEMAYQFNRAWASWSGGIAASRTLVRRNVDLLSTWAEEAPGVTVIEPTAGVPYRVLAFDVPDAAGLCASARVGVVPGSAFGLTTRHIRLGLGGARAELERGLGLISDGLARRDVSAPN